jgi:hypothetical protein
MLGTGAGEVEGTPGKPGGPGLAMSDIRGIPDGSTFSDFQIVNMTRNDVV